jgi:hypothetical protein
MGFDIILTSQNDRQVDRQVRCQFELEVKHRKINNMGMLLSLMPITVFVCIETYYGNKLLISRSFMLYKKKIAAIYDSYVMFDEFIKEMAAEHGETQETKTNIPTDGVAEAIEPGSEKTTNCVGYPATETTERVIEEALTPSRREAPVAQMGRGPAGEGHPSERPSLRGDWWMKAFIEAPIKGNKKAV